MYLLCKSECLSLWSHATNCDSIKQTMGFTKLMLKIEGC